MRLSDAGPRRQAKAVYPDHQFPPWFTEDATRDRSNRLLGTRATSNEGEHRDESDHHTHNIHTSNIGEPKDNFPDTPGVCVDNHLKRLQTRPNAHDKDCDQPNRWENRVRKFSGEQTREGGSQRVGCRNANERPSPNKRRSFDHVPNDEVERRGASPASNEGT